MSLRRLILPLGALLATAAAHAELPLPMIGRQSHNEGIRAVPAPGSVKIDGNLSEWDFSGRIWSFADISIRDRYSAESAVMWDQDYLYLALKFRDPSPLINTIDPAFDHQSGWKGDALQLRVLTDTPQWLTLWRHSGTKKSVMHLARWKDTEDSRKGTTDKLYIGQPDAVDVGDEIQMAYLPEASGAGYTQEVRIPWKILYQTVPEIKAGLTLRMGMEFFWGRPGESTWPAHRYTDNLQKGESSREFFWTAKRAWGDVTLQPKGGLEMLKYVLPGQKLQGNIPLRLTIPASAKEFTVVIESHEGRRIRNLGAQLDPELYHVSTDGDIRTVEVLWDGTDDHGKMVPAGTYTSRGLTHQGLGADYIMSFFNPGTPPWDTGGKGAWGADHGVPRFVAAAGDWTIVGWGFAEGGHGIIGIGPDGLKKWGEKRGASALAADTKCVYFSSNSWHTSGNLCRLDKSRGTYLPFKLEGKERPFELPLTDIFGDSVPGKVQAIASSGTTLALGMSEGVIALLDASSARLIKSFQIPSVTALAYSADGRLYAISNGQVVAIDSESGSSKAVATPGVAELSLTALTVDDQGHIGVYDQGSDQQVKFYQIDGGLVRTAGHAGGRPLRGDFNEQAMVQVKSIAANKKGELWSAEAWEYPRRVSVWANDGKLIRDYVGNTGYSGTGAFLHDEDPTLAYYGPVEMKLDAEKRTWKVTRVLWVPGEGEHFPIDTHSHTHPHRFSSSAGGKKREFMYAPPYRNYMPHVLYMEGDDGWRPVAAIGALGCVSGEIDKKGNIVSQPSGDYAGNRADDTFFWNDLDGNGRISRAEMELLPNPKPAETGKACRTEPSLGCGWGNRMAPEDLSFYTVGLARYAPVRFTDDGAPVYTPKSRSELSTEGNGDTVPLLAEKAVLALLNKGNFSTTGLHALDAQTGAERWSYPNPYPSVHGSHRAPMPQPGLLIGPLKILGTASLPNDNGHLFGLRGNLGQDFYYTSDGLFIGTIFQDGRLPSMSLPAAESELVGAPMESYGGGAEPFSGWLGRHRDGKVRFTNGIAGQAAMVYEMKGLEHIRRFMGPSLSVNDQQLADAARANDARKLAAQKGAIKEAVIQRVSPALSVDDKGDAAWKKFPTINIQSSASNYKGRAQLAYDETHLYFSLEAEDSSPWLNEGVNAARLFKTGDAVDLQLGTDPSAPADRLQPVKGDLRVVIASLNGKPTAVLMKPISPTTNSSHKRTYTSPVGDKSFDEVRVLDDVQIHVQKLGAGYRIRTAIPLSALELRPAPGMRLRGDLGFISSDAGGRINLARTYWSNQATNLVADEPLEAWLTPASWGTFEFK